MTVTLFLVPQQAPHFVRPSHDDDGIRIGVRLHGHERFAFG